MGSPEDENCSNVEVEFKQPFTPEKFFAARLIGLCGMV